MPKTALLVRARTSTPQEKDLHIVVSIPADFYEIVKRVIGLFKAFTGCRLFSVTVFTLLDVSYVLKPKRNS